MANLLMVVAPENFRDEEYFEPRAVLVRAGHNITVASTHVGELKGKLGGQANADIALKDVNAPDYDAIIFVGGMGSAIFVGKPEVNNLIDKMMQDNKIVGAICYAPSILAKAGVLNGKQATCATVAVNNIVAGGAEYTNESVVEEDNIITADGPQSATAFGQAIASSLLNSVRNI